MHTLAVHLAPVIAADKSKVPFYIAGGLLILWALIVSLGIGMRRDDFPGSQGAERAVIAISAVLAIAAVSTAVITSEAPAHKVPVNPGTTIPPTAPPPVVGQPVVASATASSSSQTAASAPAAATPAATTGNPPPPSSPATKAAGATALSLAANPTGVLSYNTKQLTAKAGTVTITMANMSPVEHNVTVAEGRKVLGATPTFVGGTKKLTLQLKPGTYTFYCSVPGHRQAGMEGTLTVS
jgi:plastocyanin